MQVSTGKVGMEGGEMQTIPGPGKLIPDLPKDGKGYIGEGTHGMLDGSGPGEVHSGPIKGYGPGYKEGPHSTKVPGNDFVDKSMPGSSSPKSGPPVHGYGPGMFGETTRYEGEKANKHSESSFYQKFESDAGGSCSSVANYKTGELTLTCKTKEGDTHIYHWANTIDDGSPIPYTGSGGWGEKPQPQVIGGLDEDSGHFNAVVSVGGKTVGGSGGNEPGTEGDEGHWYGGIFASAGRPNNPDDPDYYTPNVLDEADKAKKVSKSGG